MRAHGYRRAVRTGELAEPEVRRQAMALRRAWWRQDTTMATGYVGILSVELHFPQSRSLKDKRMFLRSAKAQLHNRVGASVAEVDHHDVWQRARLTLSCVARELREAERLLDEAERYLGGREWEVGPVERDVVRLEDR